MYTHSFSPSSRTDGRSSYGHLGGRRTGEIPPPALRHVPAPPTSRAGHVTARAGNARAMDRPPRRVGLLVPSSNTVMEPDLQRGLPVDVTLHTGRMLLGEVTPDGERRMLDEAALPAARALGTAEPHLTVFGCTSAGALRGLEADAEMAERIEAVTGAPTVSVIRAVRDRLRTLGVQRLAVATPYTAALTGRVTAALDDMVDVVAVAHLGLTDNRRIGDTSPRTSRRSSATSSAGPMPTRCSSRAPTCVPSRRSTPCATSSASRSPAATTPRCWPCGNGWPRPSEARRGPVGGARPTVRRVDALTGRF